MIEENERIIRKPVDDQLFNFIADMFQYDTEMPLSKYSWRYIKGLHK